MDLLKSLLSSKKFVAFIVGLIVTILAKAGILIPEDVVLEVVGLTSSFIIAQGVADAGKEKAKIEKGV